MMDTSHNEQNDIEQALLHEIGLTLPKLLEYDHPNEEELDKLRTVMGSDLGMVEFIISNSLRHQCRDTFNNTVGSLGLSATEEQYAEGLETELKNHSAKVQVWLSRNLYPGKGFSKEKAQQLLKWVEEQPWNLNDHAALCKRYKEIIEEDNI